MSRSADAVSFGEPLAVHLGAVIVLAVGVDRMLVAGPDPALIVTDGSASAQ